MADAMTYPAVPNVDPIDIPGFANTVLWVGFGCMFASFLYFYGLLRSAAPGKKLFHVYTCGIVGFASTAYLFMALGHGAILVNREIFFYARYLDWLVTTPLLLLDLAALAGVSMEDSMMLVLLDVLMVLAGLGGGLTTGRASLLMWVLGCVFFVPIVYDLAITFREKAANVGEAVGATYNKLVALTVVIWTLYPIIFFLSEYSRMLSTNTEVLCYAIMDVTAKCVFGFILLTNRDSLEQATSGYSAV